MKRIIIFGIVLGLLLGLTGCSIINTKSVTQEQAKKHFADYEKQLKTVLKPYHLTMIREEEDDDDSKYGIYRHYLIALDDTAHVEVYFRSNATKDVNGLSDTGREEFSVIYYNDDIQKEINVELFVNLVNTVSGRTITKEHCEMLLSDPEGNDDEKQKGEKIRKEDSSWNDWAIGYTLYDDDTEELSFGGLTKEGTKK